MDTIIKNEEDENPLEWYSLTETANSILNGLIAYTCHEEIKELEKECPDTERVKGLQALFVEVHAVNDDPENFQSQDRMKEIIARYGGLLKH
ncbi:hypothetical protein [Olivibacter domesticus]|nr:hypothetical protein [Olivibacter domesticus]